MTILPCLRRGHTVNTSSTVVRVVQLGWVSAIAWCVLACESKSNFEGGPKDSMGAGGEDPGVSTRQGEGGAETTSNGTTSNGTTSNGTTSTGVTSQRPCNSAADCLADFPRCEAGLCASCAPADHAGCEEDLPFCLSTADQPPACVECQTDSDCADGVCEASACVTRCAADTDCSADEPHCSSGGVCVQCGPDAACEDPSLSCSEGGSCVECLADTDCPASTPACRGGMCSCELDINQLSTDFNNCGGCGVACTAGDICAAGTCSTPTRSRFTLVAGGGVSRNTSYTLIFSAGEAPGGNTVVAAGGTRLHMGFVGVSSE